MQRILNNIQKRVDEITELLSDSKFSCEDLANYRAKEAAVLTDFQKFIDHRQNNTELCEISDLMYERVRLNETLSADLMEVKTRYVITNQPRLNSPAGFSIIDRVFIQPELAIHTDNEYAKLPASNVPLYRHNIDELVAKYRLERGLSFGTDSLTDSNEQGEN